MSSRLQYDGDGNGIVRSASNYAMLNNYCGEASVPLGVKNVAPNYMPYGANPMFQNIPVFTGVNYDQAPYVNSRMGCGAGCNGNGHYCTALAGYHVPTTKDGNPMSETTYNSQGGRNPGGYESVVYVSRAPSTQINQTCATFSPTGGCTTNQLLSKK